jgi:two-component system phosphate regulon response regulator PhoB
MNAEPVVYLVDDDLATAHMYRLGLTEAGFRPVVVSDANALFEALDDEVPDLLVLDWQLQGITGGDVLRALRGDQRTAEVPVLFLSNYSPESSFLEGQITGNNAFAWLVKARTTPDQLSRRLREACDQLARRAS